MSSQKPDQETQTKQNITLDRGARARTIIQIGALKIDVSRRLFVVVLLALVIQSGAIYLGYQRIILRLPDAPKGEMSGTFNIAVAQFGKQDGTELSASAKGKRLAEEVYRRVEQNFKNSSIKYDIRSMEIFSDAPMDSAKLEDEIEEVSANIKADWVVYGYLHEDGKSLSISVYLNAFRMPGVRELTGHYKVLDPNTGDNIETNQAAFDELLDKVTEQSESLAYFGLGLGYFSMDRIEESKNFFTLAEIPGIEDKFKQVIYLFQSKVKLLASDFEGARAILEEANELGNGNYARALLGLGLIDDLRIRNSQVCVSTNPEYNPEQADPESTVLESLPFEEALQRFEDAREAVGYDAETKAYDINKVGDDDAYIPIKADYYTGRVYHCMSIAGFEDRWIDAECSFWSVIYFARLEGEWLPEYCHLPEYYVTRRLLPDEADEQSRSAVSRNLAALAYSDLARMNWELGRNMELQWGQAEAEKYYTHIEDFFRQAIQLGDHADERALNYIWLADYYAKHDRCEDAQQQLQRASEEYYDTYLKDNPNHPREDLEAFYAEVESSEYCN